MNEKQPLNQRKELASMTYAALASMSDGVVVNDIQGQVITFNRAAARILKLLPEEVIGKSVKTLFEPYAARGRMAITEAMRRLYADPYSYGHSGQPAETIIEVGGRFIQARLSPVLTDVGEFLGVVTLLRDITREVEAERSRSDFVSNISHELRLPLTAIKGYCDLLLQDADELGEERLGFLKIVQQNADHLVALINDLLDISRVESYRLNLNIQRVRIDQVIRDAAEAIQPLCGQRGLRLTLDIEPNVPPVLGDRERLKQVVMNLVNHACRVTPSGGRITMALSGSEEGVRVDISDMGTPISPEDKERIFERFHRSEDAVSYEVRGTGLELPVAKMLVEIHGGRLWVESGIESNGVGNTFTFILPTRVDIPQDVSPELEEPTSPRTILVVEDDLDIAQLIALQLRREGFEVLTTAYGEEAISLTQTHNIDLITLDMMLPDINGMEVLHQIKTNPQTADIPVIIVSVLLPDQTGGAEQSVVDHITKPFAFEKLMESIRRTLDGQA